MVPEKRELFFAHLILSCDGQWTASTWVPDEWGEPTQGKKIDVKYAVGREKEAWTVEAAVPISAFGYAVTPRSVWAVGFNREKQTEPLENSSYQGGFNAPTQYPDLVFADRALVADGLGVRNIGGRPLAVNVRLAGISGAAGQGRFPGRPGRRRCYLPLKNPRLPSPMASMGAPMPRFEVSEDAGPRFCGFSIAIFQGDDLFPAIRQDPDDHQASQAVLFQANIEVDAIRPDVDVLLSGQ